MMNKKIDKIDLLFLDYITEFGVPISWLFHDKDSQALNKPHHNLSSDEVNARLTKLCSLGLISFGFNPSPHSNIYYEMTPKGFAEWSEAFEPNWKNYVINISDELSWSQTLVKLQAIDRDFLIQTLTDCFDFSFQEHEIITINEPWEISTHYSVPQSYFFMQLVEHDEEFSINYFDKFYQNTSYCLKWDVIKKGKQ